MNKNLSWKLGLSVGTVLLFLYGIFGIPNGVSGNALGDGLLNESPLRNGIHLGLDLKGGIHLILQVQVNDAVNSTSDRAVDLLKEQLANLKITSTDINNPDPTKTTDS